jgi:hypothetical protein
MNLILKFGGPDVRKNFLEMLEDSCPGVKVKVFQTLPDAIVYDLVSDEVAWVKQNIPGFGTAHDEIKYEPTDDGEASKKHG